MTALVCLDSAWSTARCLTRTVPVTEPAGPGQPARALVREPHAALKGQGGLRTQGYYKTSGPADGAQGAAAAPLVTIITVVFNGAKTVEQTIRSVLAQTYDNVEYIVVDGGSTDGTLEILRRYEHAIDYWVSEKDQGISDAFNKGIALSTGEYHTILNADDWYDRTAISDLVAGLAGPAPAVLVCANARILGAQDEFLKLYSSRPSKLMNGMTLAHNTCMVATRAVLDVGAYDVGKRVAMDHHLMLRLLRAYGEAGFVKVERSVSNYRMGGGSYQFAAAGFREVRDNVIEYGVSPALAHAQYLIHVLKHHLSRWLHRFGLRR